jgi:hypothetical protein
MIEFLWNVFFRGRWRSALITHNKERANEPLSLCLWFIRFGRAALFSSLFPLCFSAPITARRQMGRREKSKDIESNQLTIQFKFNEFNEFD